MKIKKYFENVTKLIIWLKYFYFLDFSSNKGSYCNEKI